LSSSSHFPLVPYSSHGKPGGVAARARQAVDEAGVNRIRDLREHDRHFAGRLLHRRHRTGTGSLDDVWRERDQFRRVSASAIDIRRTEPIVDLQVATLGPA
jgi:hypothetical protein